MIKYKCSDGTEFNDIRQAEAYQDHLEKNRKLRKEVQEHLDKIGAAGKANRTRIFNAILAWENRNSAVTTEPAQAEEAHDEAPAPVVQESGE